MERETIFARINREVDEAKRQRAKVNNIWDNPSVWLEIGRDSGGLRPVEDFVFAYHAHSARKASPTLRDIYTTDSLMNALRSVWREVINNNNANSLSKVVVLSNHDLPLREVMKKRGTTLQWIDLGRDMMGRKSVAVVEAKTTKIQKA